MRRRRPLAVLLASSTLVALPAMATAHSEIEASEPLAGASLDEPPTEVVITFDAELDPASTFTVTDERGEPVGTGGLDLDVAERNVLRGDVDISEPATFTVSWSAVSVDGHRETGAFSFGYRADPTTDPEAGGGATTPDTALPLTAGQSWLALAGLALVAAAGAMGARRATAPGGAR